MKRAVSVRAPRQARLCRHEPSCSRADTDALQVARESLISLGVCIGKFTHSNKFILTIGALDILAQHAKYKVRLPWLSAAPRPSLPDDAKHFQSSNRCSHERCGFTF